MKHVIDALKASKRKATHQRNNWKARAIALEKELNAYKAWAAKVDKWHTKLCKMCSVEPVYSANGKDDTRPSAMHEILLAVCAELDQHVSELVTELRRVEPKSAREAELFADWRRYSRLAEAIRSFVS